MNPDPQPKRTRRFILILSGATDALLGMAILLTGFGFFPINIADYGLPLWAVVLAGGIMFTMGTWVAVYNYTRLDE